MTHDTEEAWTGHRMLHSCDYHWDLGPFRGARGRKRAADARANPPRRTG